MAEFPELQRTEALAVVQRYRELWRSEDWRVSCRRDVSGPGVSQVDGLTPDKLTACPSRVLWLPYDHSTSGVVALIPSKSTVDTGEKIPDSAARRPSAT